jgi:ubiquinone/menaquinone biosynthesis C-methylase UbiE
MEVSNLGEVINMKGDRVGLMSHSMEDICYFLTPYGTVLDIGCGGGRHSIYLKEKGLQVLGIDISGEQLKKAKTSIEVIRADAHLLPLEANSVDCVLCSEVLEHLAAPDQCINEVHRVLKYGGIACFTTPCLNIPLPAIIPIYRKLIGVKPEMAKEHLRVFSDKVLINMLRQFFTITDVKYTNFTTIIDRTLGIGYGLDRPISKITKKLPILHYLAASVWVKVIKK